MNADELIALIENDGTTKEQIIEGVKNFSNEAGERYAKKDRETLKFKHALKNIGYSKEEFDGVDEFVSNVTTQLTSSDEKVNLLASKLAEYERREAEINAKNEYNTIESKLNAAIGKRLKGSNYIIKDLINSKSVKIVDGDVVFVDGDKVKLFDDGVASVIENNKDLEIVDQRRGAQSIISDSRVKSEGITVDRIYGKNLTPDEIKANIGEIKKMAGLR